MVENPADVRRELGARLSARAREHNGMLVLVTGLPGTGKTQFMRELGDLAPAQQRTHYVAADEYERMIPFAFVERVFSSGLGVGPVIAPETASPEVARQLIDALTDLPDGGTRTVLLDDAQWIDADSAAVLRFVAPRIARRGVFLVVASRVPYEKDSLCSALAGYVAGSSLHEDVAFEPLSIDEIRAIALATFGTGISVRTASVLRDATGGTYLGISKLFARVTASEIQNLHLTWNLPIRRELLPESPFLAGYAALSRAGRAAVEIVSLAPYEIARSSVVRVAQRAGEEIDLDEALAAGMVVESGFGATLQIAHALIGASVREALGAARTRELCRGIAEVTDDGYLSIAYALRGAEEWTDALEAQVEEFVRSAVDERRFALAFEVLRASLDVATGASRGRLLTGLALLNMRMKTAFAVLDLFDEIEALPPTATRECIMIVLLMYRMDQEAAMARLGALLARPSDDADVRTVQAFLAFMSLIMVLRSPDPAIPTHLIAAAQAIWADAPTRADELADERLAWMVGPREYEAILAAYGIVSAHLEYRMDAVGRVLPGIVAQTLALPDTDLKVDALVPVIGALVAVNDIARAGELAEIGIRIALQSATPPWSAGTIRVMHAHTLALAGRFSEARTAVENYREFSYDFIEVETRFTLAALQSFIMAITGEPGAEALLAETQRLESLSWEAYANDLTVMAACEIARSSGNPAGVLAVTEPERTKRFRNTQRGYLSYRAQALIALGRLDEAAELIDWLDRERGVRWQENHGTCSWLRACLAAARGEHDSAVRHFEAALEGSDEAVSPLPLGSALVDYGRFLAVRGDRESARKALTEGRALIERCGARAYLPGIDAEIGALVRRDQDAQDERLALLTPREREVAAHLAAGSSNALLAEALFISQATARFHVSNVLRKLGVSRRGEVAGAISRSE